MMLLPHGWVYSGTSLFWSPWGLHKLAGLSEWPHFREPPYSGHSRGHGKLAALARDYLPHDVRVAHGL